MIRKVKPYFSKMSFDTGPRRKARYSAASGFAVIGRRHRIGDRLVRIGREGADDLHARIDLGIGLVDDAERRFAARHQRQRRAHVFGHREFRFGRGPGAELLQRRLGIFADRHRFHVAGGDAAVAREPGEIEALTDGHVADLGILRRDQHQLVAEQVDAGVVLDDLLLRAVIHPVEVGGGEDVGRRAGFDLLHQRGACGVARHDLDAGLPGEGGVDVVQRIFHRGGGEDGEGLVLRGRALGRRARSSPRAARAELAAEGSSEHGGSPRHEAAFR